MTGEPAWCEDCGTKVMPIVGNCPVCRRRVVEPTRAVLVVAIRNQLARLDPTSPDG